VVIHRAISGSLERFMGMIIEHFSGAFPLWLSPVQVKVLCVGESHQTASQKLVQEFQAADIRAELDDSDETVGNKTRKAINEKVPYILVMGDKEVESGQVAVRTRNDRQIREMDKAKFLDIVTSDIDSRALKLSIGTEG
jgi:threonyl-tRNA synthetase